MIDAVLDTSILVELLRQSPDALQWAQKNQNRRYTITPIVWMETVQGARNKIERQQIMRFLRTYHIEHSTAADNYWAMLQLSRFHLSHGVELADVMIASVAARLGVPLYTLNIKHYAPLPLNSQKPY